MITITFQATSLDNLVRQLTAFVDKVDLEKGGKKRGKHERKEDQADRVSDARLAE